MSDTQFQQQVLIELQKLNVRIQILENKISNLDSKIMITDMHVMSLGYNKSHEESQDWKNMKDQFIL